MQGTAERRSFIHLDIGTQVQPYAAHIAQHLRVAVADAADDGGLADGEIGETGVFEILDLALLGGNGLAMGADGGVA